MDITKPFILFNGDCVSDTLDIIPDGSIDMVLVDPPYGTTKYSWDSIIDLEKMWNLIERLLKPSGAAVFWAKQPFTSVIVNSKQNMFKQTLVWDKQAASNHPQAKRRHMSVHEDIIIFYKTQCTYNPQMTDSKVGYVKRARTKGKRIHWRIESGFTPEDVGAVVTKRYPKSIIVCPRDRKEKRYHPTQKPVKLAEYLIKTYTNKGDIVLDFCMGSGTTGVAAMNCRRKFIGCEKTKEYYDVASERINKAADVIY